MMKLAAIVEIARALIRFCDWAVEQIRETIRRRKLEEIHDATEQATKAKTRDEKIEAAKRLEDAAGLHPPGRDV